MMLGLFRAARRLREQGLLGINARNAAYILDHNPRALFPLVDDKLKMRDLCRRIHVPTPDIYQVIAYPRMLRKLSDDLRGRDDFVIKPNRGSAGRGILVIIGRDGSNFVRHNGTRTSLDEIRQHLSDVLSGLYSLGAHPDKAILQQRIRLHRVFESVSYKGIPDIRVVLYRNEPAMAMLRLPTRVSAGRANLHQGGIGVGIDLPSGRTNHAVCNNRAVDLHPDTGTPLVGLRIPFWEIVLDMSCRVARAVGLGYLGVDIVIDAELGPMLLEANARPGLAIQIANRKGLLPRLAEIDARNAEQLLLDASEACAGRIEPKQQPERKSA
jgi:alpha-L-glutamate ligase-like protein